MQSKKKKVFTEIFVRKPFGFVIFLVLGTTVFLFIAARIQVPVYTTVKARVEKKDDGIRINLNNTTFQAGTPVFLYHARDEHLEKVTEYRLADGCIVIEHAEELTDGEKINIDIQTKEVPLLKHLFSITQ